MSAINEVGESILSISRTVTFANLPNAPQSLTLQAEAEPATITAKWTAPDQVNGDVVAGYLVYVDDGLGGPFSLAFNGTGYPSTYSFKISDGLTCGRLYFV